MQPLDDGPTETVWLIVAGPLTLIASACDPGAAEPWPSEPASAWERCRRLEEHRAVIGGGGVAIGAGRLMFAAD